MNLYTHPVYELTVWVCPQRDLLWLSLYPQNLLLKCPQSTQLSFIPPLKKILLAASWTYVHSCCGNEHSTLRGAHKRNSKQVIVIHSFFHYKQFNRQLDIRTFMLQEWTQLQGAVLACVASWTYILHSQSVHTSCWLLCDMSLHWTGYRT